MKKLRLILISLLGLVSLVMISLTVFLNTLDLNDYKKEIAQKLHELTGYDVSIKGGIGFSLIPSIALEVGKVHIENQHKTLAVIPSLSTKIDPWALLDKKINILSLRLKDPFISYQTDLKGHSNWQIPITPSTTRQNKQNGSKEVPVIRFERLTIVNGQLKIQQPDQTLHLTQLNFCSSNVALNEAIHFQLKAKVVAENQDKKLSTNLKLLGTAKLTAKQLPIRDLMGKLTVDATNTLSQFQYNKLKFNKIISKLSYKNKQATLIIKPFTGYGASLQGMVVFKPNQQWLKTSLSIKSLKLHSFLKDLNGTNSLSGEMSGTVNLVSQGKTLNDKLRHLNGSISTDIQHGAIHGLDLHKLGAIIGKIAGKSRSLQQYVELSFKQLSDPKLYNTGQTTFNHLSTKLNIHQGIATTKTLSMDTKTLDLSGHGQANILKQTLAFKLLMQAPRAKGPLKSAMKLMGGGIPITINGTFQSPKAKPDSKFIISRLKSAILKDGKKSFKKTINVIKKKLKLF